jgi:pilus assembly protein CpaF
MTCTRSVFVDTLAHFFAPIDHLLVDESVCVIFVNRFDRIFVERNGALERADARFPSESHLTAALTNLAQSVGRSLHSANPRLEATLPGGSRVVALMPPVAVDGPCVTIRCIRAGNVSIDSFCAGAEVPTELRTLLAELVSRRSNVVICGETACGKTTLLGALASRVPSTERVVVIEDRPELRVEHDHSVRLVSSRSLDDDAPCPTTSELLRTTLEVRADRIVLGDLRASAILELLEVLACSRAALLTSMQSTGPREALDSLEWMVRRRDPDGSRGTAANRVLSAVDAIVHVDTRSDGRRCIASVSRVLGCENDVGFVMRSVYQRST